jgi:hypothetical protein
LLNRGGWPRYGLGVIGAGQGVGLGLDYAAPYDPPAYPYCAYDPYAASCPKGKRFLVLFQKRTVFFLEKEAKNFSSGSLRGVRAL